MKSHSIFPNLPDDSRVWTYAFQKKLSDPEKTIVQGTLDGFLKDWNSHGVPVIGKSHILYNQFVILSAEPTSDISGCSIDSSVRIFKLLKEDHGLDALNLNLVHFREGEKIRSVDRSVFLDHINSEKISPDTIVFNTTIQTLGEIRGGLWETKLRNSWHAKAFKIPA